MIITSVQRDIKNKKIFSIYIDDYYSFKADIEDIYEFDIKENRELLENELNSIIKKCQYKKAYHFILKFLAIKSRTKKEIFDKLKNSNYTEDIITDIILKLEEINYINDLDYAEKYINDNINSKKVSINHIKNTLKNKGIKIEVIENIINRSEINDLDIAILIIKNRFLKANKNNRDFKKIYNYLLYRGFDYNTINEAINICFDTTITNY